jgi:hypothetical protein
MTPKPRPITTLIITHRDPRKRTIRFTALPHEATVVEDENAEQQYGRLYYDSDRHEYLLKLNKMWRFEDVLARIEELEAEAAAASGEAG